MILVDGVWVVEPCADQWVKIPKPIVNNEVPRQRSYDDTLPPVSTFSRVLRKQWADVCLEVCEIFVSGKLLPVGSIYFCRSLPAVQPVCSFAPRQPTVLALRISQFCTVFLDYSLFSRLPTVDIRNFVGSIASERTFLCSVQSSFVSSVVHNVQMEGSPVLASQNLVSATPRVQLLDEHPLSASTSEDSAMNFDEINTAATSTSLPAASIPQITEALAKLRASMEQISERDDGAKHKDTLLLHLHDLERKFTARFDAHDRVLGALNKDSNDQRILMSLDLNHLISILAQISNTDLDVVDVRRVVREHYLELNAKINSLDEQVAATRNDFLEFSAQAQQTLNIITDQLSELVAYINHGGNDKKGEVGSSRGPQPPPDDQNRGSGTTCGGGDTDRNIVERLMTADRQRQRERSRGNMSGSYKSKRY
ncbi:hypothetical protein F511_18434 [Dorcoceras hygrometricum]|uniref:Uncharacterized protein n=1 Tax=Dorcoceras hygrometricum TaxID=472368 RepID=A0A2Z7C8P6_9LAMI|nr:hypothetical protein F511_18434 [Dorcoceras hygrometricum]